MLLGVNIDHIALLREGRKVNDPSLIDALGVCKIAGANQITIHLREDRRHIQDRDVEDIIKHSKLPINLEISTAKEIVDIACKLKPHRVTLVPEKREEVTTEGGLNLKNEKLKENIKRLQSNEIEVSLFIDPTFEAIKKSSKLKVEWVEFHTGKYANIYAMLYSNLPYTNHSIKSLEKSRKELKELLENELKELRLLSCDALEMGLKVSAGHGLNMQNVKEIAQIETIEELNIGQSIIASSIYIGLENAIKEIKKVINKNNNK